MKTIGRMLILSMLHLCWLTSYGWAEMVKTQEILKEKSPPRITRAGLIEVLHREEGRQLLDQYGVSQVEAVARINSLSDEEIAELAAQVGSLPAGGFDSRGFAEGLAGAIALAILAIVLAFYLFGVFAKSLVCLFSDCESRGGAGWIFTPVWKDEQGHTVPEFTGEDTRVFTKKSQCDYYCFSVLNTCMEPATSRDEEDECQEANRACLYQCAGEDSDED